MIGLFSYKKLKKKKSFVVAFLCVIVLGVYVISIDCILYLRINPHMVRSLYRSFPSKI